MSDLDGPSIEIARLPGNKSYAKVNEAGVYVLNFKVIEVKVYIYKILTEREQISIVLEKVQDSIKL